MEWLEISLSQEVREPNPLVRRLFFSDRHPKLNSRQIISFPTIENPGQWAIALLTKLWACGFLGVIHGTLRISRTWPRRGLSNGITTHGRRQATAPYQRHLSTLLGILIILGFTVIISRLRFQIRCGHYQIQHSRTTFHHWKENIHPGKWNWYP